MPNVDWLYRAVSRDAELDGRCPVLKVDVTSGRFANHDAELPGDGFEIFAHSGDDTIYSTIPLRLRSAEHVLQRRTLGLDRKVGVAD